MKITVPILVEKKEYCCGCGACAAACKINAISMKCDEYGFEYPSIDETKCVGCGKCKNVCAYQKDGQRCTPINSYAAVSVSTDVMQSASGGVFASIATEFIKQGGIVIGAALENINDVLTPHHIAVDNCDDLQKLLGSKYVHSDTAEIFEKTKEILNDGKMVLFSGTPCQVDALYTYLGKKQENLYTIDLICHGVPSKKMFSDYIDLISAKYGKVKDFVFRDKKRGLTFVSRALCEKNGNKKYRYIQYGESSYYSNFLKCNTYREGCYSCKYAANDRIGDITIGDFWGIKKQHPELFDGSRKDFDADKGISCILENTEQGKKLLDLYGSGLSLYQSTFEKIAEENKQLSKPSIPKGNRTDIMELYKENGYKALDNYFRKQAGYKLILAKIKSRIPLWLKNIIKN
ncbi:MAG: Coenzyme F420 hydrogenase/dehydrogenase, beta subunit C-terminal domain [Clostridium sp.]|nr:Coenzyme F420 hydrogenase/dehydrogenase, beta subunit C-terminal domain [Clostridium sp.]